MITLLVVRSVLIALLAGFIIVGITDAIFVFTPIQLTSVFILVFLCALCFASFFNTTIHVVTLARTEIDELKDEIDELKKKVV